MPIRMSEPAEMSTVLNDVSHNGVICENVLVEVVNEEVVSTDLSTGLSLPYTEGDFEQNVKIEVTVVNSDGSTEITSAHVVPQPRLKRSASSISSEGSVPKKFAAHSSCDKGYNSMEDTVEDMADVIISLAPDQQVLDEDSSSAAAKQSQSFKCFLCGNKTKFAKWSELLSHFNNRHCTTEDSITTCECPSCGLLLTIKQEGGIDDFDSLVLNTLSHMVREHDYSDDNVTKMTQKIDKNCAGKVRCDKCDSIVRADYMKKHLAHYCKGCKNVFDCKCGKKILPGAIESHANVCAFLRTEKACTCPECGLLFKTVHNMELHFRRCHLKESRYACEICGEKFFKRDVLVQHNYIVHNVNVDSRPVLACTFENCDFTAIYAYHLNQHVKRQHEKGPFICERCDKICNTYYTLNRHQCVFRQLRGRRVTAHVSPVEKKRPSTSLNPGNIHSTAACGGRIYKCGECNFTNVSRKRVELHGRIHRDGILEGGTDTTQGDHGDGVSELQETQELLYCCVECGFASGDETVLRDHIDTEHSAEMQMMKPSEVDMNSSETAIAIDTISLPHKDAEAISLLNHFKMGSNEVVFDSISESADSPEVILEVVPSETESFQAGSDFIQVNTAPDLSALPEEVVESPAVKLPVQANPSILPKKSTALAKNAPRLFHELTKSGALIKPGKKKQTIVRPVEALQEYKIVFQNSDDHPAPPGQVILLSPEDAEQLKIQQSSDVHINE